jgi:hypothetical protein
MTTRIADLSAAQKLLGRASTKLRYVFIISAIYAAQAIISVTIFGNGTYGDSDYYLAMAAGHSTGVTEPFADRILGPWLASVLSYATGMSIRNTLATVCTLPWLLIGWPIGLILYRAQVPLRWALRVALIPFPIIGATYYLVPDGLEAFFLLILLLSLDAGQVAGITLAAGFATLARSSGALGALLWSASRYRKGLGKQFLLTALGVICALLIIRTVSNHDSHNIHNINPILYYFSKPPINYMANVFGFHIYSNTYHWCEDPIFATKIPPLSLLGHVDTLGICPFNAHAIVESISCYFFMFGIFPLMIFVALAQKSSGNYIERRRALMFSLLFLLSPGFGTTISRLFIEAFPFLIPAASWAILAIPQGRDEVWRKRATIYGGASLLAIYVVYLR